MGVGFSNLMSGFSVDGPSRSLGLCAVTATDGLYRVLFALQNRGMDGFWATLVGRAVSIFRSAWMVKFLGVSSLVVPGLALGLGLISGGFSRIVVSLYGRDYANQALDSWVPL
ncbi:hypothetical protein IV203_003792 [Nitzschia inconspicua]|uniref:Uncharacterized protein n=1 Tax=Nitzschia inconspicua TaxID=303405 RepID=A0A9K3L452_9STRA|nr:hypothetical protein IV203_003792 [Nitzschia inconspicua]